MIKPQDQLRDWADSGVSSAEDLKAIADYIDELERCVDQTFDGLRLEFDEKAYEETPEDHRLNEMAAAYDWARDLREKRRQFVRTRSER